MAIWPVQTSDNEMSKCAKSPYERKETQADHLRRSAVWFSGTWFRFIMNHYESLSIIINQSETCPCSYVCTLAAGLDTSLNLSGRGWCYGKLRSHGSTSGSAMVTLLRELLGADFSNPENKLLGSVGFTSLLESDRIRRGNTGVGLCCLISGIVPVCNTRRH